jgi:P2 family phage contractile tail tube protein
MQLPQILRNMNLYVNGRSHAGVIGELMLPKLKLKTEDFQGGGMDAPIEIEVGMEKLEASATIHEYDAATYAMFGLTDGNQVNITARGALTQGDQVVPIVVVMHGSWNEIDPGTWKVGQKVEQKISMNLKYYSLSINNLPVVLIDIPNMKRVIGGVDALAEIKAAIGL